MILGLSPASAPEPQSTRNVIIPPANSNCDLHDILKDCPRQLTHLLL
jgi:hypothetical protein